MRGHCKPESSLLRTLIYPQIFLIRHYAASCSLMHGHIFTPNSSLLTETSSACSRPGLVRQSGCQGVRKGRLEYEVQHIQTLFENNQLQGDDGVTEQQEYPIGEARCVQGSDNALNIENPSHLRYLTPRKKPALSDAINSRG